MQEQAAAASARCSSVVQAPRAAFCIAGAARSFVSPLVAASFRHHFLGAFGIGNNSRVFLALKTSDSDKMSGRHHDPGTIRFRKREIPEDAILHIVQSQWLTRLLGEAVIIKGNGAFLGNNGAGQEGHFLSSARRVRVVDGNDTLWQEYRPSCLQSGSRSSVSPSPLSSDEERLIHDKCALCSNRVGAVRR